MRKAVKWNTPFYGVEGQGWFLGFHVFTHYVKVTFFLGTSLRSEDDLDEAQLARWVKQAASIRGNGGSPRNGGVAPYG